MTCACGIESPLIDYGSINGVEWHTHAAPLRGAVNGYFRVPVGHHLWGRSVFDPDNEYWTCLDGQPGGARELTYSYPDDSNPEWFGFDTLHSFDRWPGDTQGQYMPDHVTWSPELVAEATQRWAEVIAAHV